MALAMDYVMSGDGLWRDKIINYFADKDESGGILHIHFTTATIKVSTKV